MGITGLLPFLEKASRGVNVSEFSGCTVAIDSYCWLHKGAFACADKLVRGEETDIHIKYCLKYVNMLLSRNIKPILVFDGRHLPAKAMTEAKRRESRDISKKRAAELLVLGKIDEARSYMRRSVDITHDMALSLIKECRKRNVDCIVAPYEADAQLAYLNIKNIAHLVITEDSDLILFGCNRVLFKMDLDGAGTLVETSKLPLVMRCPIERYTFDKFRQMCIMSGCDYLASLPGIGLAKARQFITATQDSNIANALKKMPSYFNKANLIVTDEYRESFLKAEATFKHQYVYDPINREMVRLTETDDEITEIALCCNAGESICSNVAFQLALGNLDPFTLKKMDDWSPDDAKPLSVNIKTDNWRQVAVSSHPSIWSAQFKDYLSESHPWRKIVKKEEPIIGTPKTRPRRKVINVINRVVPETQDESLTIESLSNMYCIEPEKKKQKVEENDTQEHTNEHNIALTEDKIVSDLTQSHSQSKSPILKNSRRMMNSTYSILKKLSSFPRTIIDDNVVESKFFNSNVNDAELNMTNDSLNENEINKDKSPMQRTPESKNPFRVKQPDNLNQGIDFQSNNDIEIDLSSSQKENSPNNSPKKRCSKSPVLQSSFNNPFKGKTDRNEVETFSEEVIENTYPMETLLTPVDSQESFGETQSLIKGEWRCKYDKRSALSSSQPVKTGSRNSTSLVGKSNCKVPGLKRKSAPSLPFNQPTLLSKFGFQKRPIMKR